MKLAAIIAEASNGLPTDYYPWFAVGGVFICIVALVMGANAIDDFLDRRKAKPGQPPNEQLENSLAHLTATVESVSADLKAHIKQNHDDHEGIHRKIGGVERGARADLEKAIASGNESRSALHKRINTCMETMGEMRGMMQALINKLK